MLLLLLACRPDPAVNKPGVSSAFTEVIPADPWVDPFTWEVGDGVTCPPTLAPDDAVAGLWYDTLGLTADIGVDPSWAASEGGRVASDPSRLSWFHEVQSDLTSVPCFLQNAAIAADDAVSQSHPLVRLVATQAALIDEPLEVGGALPEPAADDPLRDAVLQLGAEEVPDTSVVPPALAHAAALVLLAAAEAAEARDEGLEQLVDDDDWSTVYSRNANVWLVSTFPVLDTSDDEFSPLYESSDGGHRRFYEGAARLLQAVDLVAWDSLAGGEDFSWSVRTELGWVFLKGSGDDAWDEEAHPELAGEALLSIDTGGDDTYRVVAGANRSAGNPVAVHLDLDGSDLYAYPELGSEHDEEGLLPADEDGRYDGDSDYGHFANSQVPRQGAGVTGYGVLIDRGGDDDQYRSLRGSQGFSSVGVGVLWDDGGNDTYEAENGVQGAALVGIAIAWDGGGDDVRRAFGSAQGFAWTRSSALLYDSGGDDTYEMVVDEILLFPSDQLQGTGNNSFGQGAAFGLRDDRTGNHLSGGVALLRDVEGADTYEAGSYGQGVAYWFGTGMLADSDGDDAYDVLFYGQGSGVHYATGVMLDEAGADLYNARREPWNTTTGAAHDFSVGVMVDQAGDDQWWGDDRSLGASKCHGLGLLVDVSGADLYTSGSRRTLGYATDYDGQVGTCGDDPDVPTYGLFVDADGDDAYDVRGFEEHADGDVWINDDEDDSTALEYGAGRDDEALVVFVGP